MIYNFLLLQVIAHLLADFIFQPQKWSNAKGKKIITWQHFSHFLIVFFFSYLLSFDVGFIYGALAISILHFFSDMLKSYLQIKSRKIKNNRSYFFLDQFVHLVIFVGISILYFHFFEVNLLTDIPFEITLIAFGFVFCSKPANLIIKNALLVFSVETPFEKEMENRNPEESIIVQKEEKSLENAGKLIGISERFIVLALILVGQYSAVGLVIAAKSILRFRSNQKNEYILVGTLLSFCIVIIVGIIISKAITD
jgi:hypothetical protein